MKRIILKILVFSVILNLSLSFSFTEERISGKEIVQYIKILAGDEFQGRKSGHLGGEKASHWIVNKFKEWGISPAGKDGYFQSFRKPFFNVDKDVLLRINNFKDKREFYYEDDWRVITNSGSGKIKSQLVFAGYGIISEKNQWNEYQNISVKDKIVLVVNEYPSFLEGKLESEALPASKFENAYKNGAKGIIFVYKPGETPRRVRLSIPPEKFKKDFIAIYANENVLNFIFSELPTDFRYLMQVIDRERKIASTALEVEVEISAQTSFDPKKEMKNIIGKIDGVDPLLKDEVVILGAHMDHLGVSPFGEVFNGANDNASGTAVVMEVARISKLNNLRPKRTMVFALWAGEEQGLLGSRYYVDHPLFPIEKTVAYFNLDMVGHGDGRINFPGIYYAPEIWEVLNHRLPPEIKKEVNTSKGGPGGSDHTSFLLKGVPGFGIMTSGFHFKYHQKRDDVDLIKPEILEKVTRFVYESMRIIAEEENLKIPALREELYILRSSTIATFLGKNISKLVEEASSINYLDLDLGFVPLEGRDFQAIINSIMEIEDRIGNSKSLSILTSPSQFQGNTRIGKLSIVPGLEDFSLISENLKLLKFLAKAGLGYLTLREDDLKDAELLKKVIKISNDSGILLILKASDSGRIKSFLEGSSKPGIIISESYDSEIQKLIKEKKWKVGLIWKKDESREEFIKRVEKVEGSGYENILIFKEEQPLKGFNESFLKLISYFKDKRINTRVINGMLGQGVIDLLYLVKGEERRVLPFIPF